MKKSYWLLASIFVVILIFFINVSNTIYATTTTSATLTNDSYVWFFTDDASCADTAYSTSDLIVQLAPKNIREIYLKFDLSNVSAPINNAKLSLYAKAIPLAQGKYAQIKVFVADDNSWNENSITYNNRPITGETEIASTSVSLLNQDTRVYFNLTDYITQNINSIKEEKNGVLTLVLKSDVSAIIKFAPKEATLERVPNLEIESSICKVTGVMLNLTELSIMAGDTRQLTASINPEDASNNAVTWTTTDDNIANVDDQGLVTAISPGTAIIRATSVDNPNAFAECTVNVVAAAEVNKIEIYGPEKITIPYSGNKDEFYSAVVKDQNGDTMPDEVVTWSIEPDVEDVTVDSDIGVVTVESSASAKSIILKALSCSNNEVFSTKTISLERETPVVAKIKISGSDSIILQRDSNIPQEVEYAVTVEDQNGNAMPNENVTWSIQPKIEGISINDQGVVAVNDDAKAGSYEIKAVSVSNPDVYGTRTLVLVSPEAPYWRDGSQLNYKNVSPTSVTLTWNAAEDNKGIVGYAVYKVDDSLLTVCDCVYSYSVSESVYFSDIAGLTPGTTYTFKVEAVDTDGNWTSDGPSTTFKTKADEKPYWQAGKKLEVSSVASNGLKLTWSDDARDDLGITNYVIYKNDEKLKTVAANVYSYEVTGLAPATDYTFKVEAVDTAGQYSDNGPVVQCTTKENFSISTSFRVGSTDNAEGAAT